MPRNCNCWGLLFLTLFQFSMAKIAITSQEKARAIQQTYSEKAFPTTGAFKLMGFAGRDFPLKQKSSQQKRTTFGVLKGYPPRELPYPYIP